VIWENRGAENPAGGKNQRRADAGERWILVCGREDFCAETRREIGRRRRDVRVGAAGEVESARQFLEAEETPAVILAEERVLAEGEASPRQRRQAIAAALSLLAGYAPVVWIGALEEAAEISAAIPPTAAVDFVPRSALCLSAAVTMVERRLRGSLAAAVPAGKAANVPFSLSETPIEGRDFGEVLRHELNNPLTGILGNAELLLLEVRRGRLQLPAHDLQRLETITDLAVRMREAVRLLSDRWEAAGRNLAEEKEPPLESHWPAGD
jgi:signal transduction histidine kinase